MNNRVVLAGRCTAGLSIALGVLAAITVSAENWPAWRGPLANGISGEKGLPTK